MAQKNRPTLKQQFQDFINRIAPYDVDPLIQKTELLQVEDDLFDSFLGKIDNSVLINSPGDLIALDFDTVDLYNINTSGSIDNVFTFTPSNISTGQIGRIDIIKKSNDTFDFSNAVIAPISNLNQAGTTLSFYIHNINGTLIASSGITIPKSDSIVSPNSDQLATSQTVFDLNVQKADKVIEIATSEGLQGGGDLSADRNLSIANQGVTSDKLAAGASVSNIGYTPAKTIFNVTDLDLINGNGIFNPTSGATNAPVATAFFDIILAVGNIGGLLSQVYIDVSSGVMYNRTKSGASPWTVWTIIVS